MKKYSSEMHQFDLTDPVICFMRELPVVALRKRGMRWRWAVVGKKEK